MGGKLAAFQYDALPRLPAASASRSLAIARGFAALTFAPEITARGIGRIRLRVEGVDPAPWRSGGAAHPSPESAFLLVRADGSVACLTIDRFFALSLVRAALNAPPPPVVRPLSPSERGVLAAIVAAALAATGIGSARVSLDRWRPIEDRDRVVINLTARTTALAGGLSLELPTAWLPSGAATLNREVLSLLTTMARVELGRTELARGAQLSAEVGDAVVFEGVSAVVAGAAWPCQIWVGGHCAQAEASETGDVRARGKFSQRSRAPEQDMSDEADQNRSGADTLAAQSAAVLAGAPVEVVAEIGRLTLRGDEVAGLMNGSVLSLGERRRDLVVLRVGGRAWARGELVTVDEDLGVRITEILRPR